MTDEAGEAKLGEVLALTAYGHPLMAVPSFNYLGRFMLASDDNWPVVLSKLHRVRQKWEHILQLIGWEEADSQTSGIFTPH